ncbi:hypothetical protein P168DRAFT_42510 [Aspergillus campestris IBT 28561]|uniref:Uncharacterized protein n=1 Tax=Aspergillus campestris (strain IBT 28561) TaxID=1392248 RepID=A0A2I1CX45_ASPC2|nr:uncharacterized protein P168DRAFT_42510 [Aspergillus campestris IBT 28561]PKY02179.1 hypothetical protein P168DRAFT_42510 [Aspergillus campestris IBT 28561]
MAIPLFLVSFRHTVTSPSPAGRGGKASRGKARTVSFSRLRIIITISIIVQEAPETPTFQWLNRRPALLEWRLDRNKRTTLIECDTALTYGWL